MFTSVLIANRGEIACRVIKTAKRLGLRTIAVYSEADAGALHVTMADEAHLIGPAPAAQSYLDMAKVLAVAKSAGAECIHPGYGFLSENAEFAEACAAAGVTFVGPPPDAIRAMGLKDAAKALMDEAGVPVVPGYHGSEQEPAQLAARADEVGYPLLIKAVAGGGGKGMRRVDEAEEFEAALASCQREAKNAFGDDRVLIERFVTAPRHVEIQVFADGHGNCVHLFERDCSLQRRHQKVVEEAPAPGMSDTVRARMGAAAVAAAKAVGYRGAGTVEFIADSSQGLREDRFFFMEMNTRLQVEHPVTEMITGQDLVEWQLRVAAGEKLPLTQDELGAANGHAVEVRIYAEDPATGFLPQTGHLQTVQFPTGEANIRVDTGVEAGRDVSPYYDPMIAKLICWAKTRDEALAGLGAALGDSAILGLRSNIGFLAKLIGHRDFAAGNFDTHFIDVHLADLVDKKPPTALLAAIAHTWIERCVVPPSGLSNEPHAPWGSKEGWTLGTARRERLYLRINNKDAVIDIERGGDVDHVTLSGDHFDVAADVSDVRLNGEQLVATVDGDSLKARIASTPNALYLLSGGRHLEARAQDLLARDDDDAGGGNVIRAPMSGKLIRLNAAKGDDVKKGAPLAVLEAMKMEHTLVAGADGTVEEVGAEAGDQVEEGQMLISLAVAD
jgi:3-methylcrotonyl-CoA carboxylase alpha subunit